MAEEKYPINIWINEERYEKLKEAGLGDMCEELPSLTAPLQRVSSCSRGT